MIKILIVEDHQMVRAGLRALLEKNRGIEIVGEAANGQEAIQLTQRLKPDVLIMDIRMPIMNGIQAAERIRELKLPTNIVLLSMYADASLVNQAIKCGAKGYVLKSAASEELIWAVQAAVRGEMFLSGTVSSLVVAQALHPNVVEDSDGSFESLSPREKEILQLIAEEHTSGEIAEQLSISEKTVEKHRSHLMEKLGVRNLAGLARLAVKFGLVDLDTKGNRIPSLEDPLR